MNDIFAIKVSETGALREVGRGVARGGPMRTSFFAPLARAAGVPAKKSESTLTHTRFAFLGFFKQRNNALQQ